MKQILQVQSYFLVQYQLFANRKVSLDSVVQEMVSRLIWLLIEGLVYEQIILDLYRLDAAI
jgi:hypothetical protein